jgi:hypothetical protein
MIPEVSHVLWELSSIWPWLHSFDSRLRSHLQAPHGQGLAGYLHNSPGISWLVVSNMAFMFHNILGIIIPSNWLFFFSEGVKPPTSYHLTILFIYEMSSFPLRNSYFSR